MTDQPDPADGEPTSTAGTDPPIAARPRDAGIHTDDQPDPAEDDLTQVAGISPPIAARLRDADIRTVDQLAQATVDQILAACGSDVSATDAQAWIEQAADLVGAAEAAGEPPPDHRPHSRRTFTVEVRIDSETSKVLATRVVHLETQDAHTWQGWDSKRLLKILETRIGVAEPAEEPTPEPEAATTVDREPVPEPQPPAVDHTAPASPPTPPVHRFGVVKAARLATSTGEAAARLRLDSADLDLPGGQTAAARIQLLARPVGRGRAVVLDEQTCDLPTDRPLDAVLPVRLPDQDPPFAISAAIWVMIDQPAGQPREDLGSATLDLIQTLDR
jgi:predicted flap endonuclease-1-like 5' DNA nuclease